MTDRVGSGHGLSLGAHCPDSDLARACRRAQWARNLLASEASLVVRLDHPRGRDGAEVLARRDADYREAAMVVAELQCARAAVVAA